MSALYTVIDPASGAAMRTEPGSLGLMFAALAEGLLLVAGEVDARTHRIDPETRQPQPLAPITATAADNALTGLPAGARVLVAGRWFLPDAQGRVALAGALGLDQDVTALIECPGRAPIEITVPLRGTGPAGAHAVAQDAARLRQGDYPDAGDQLDALWKALDALAAGRPMPADAAEVLARVREVKRKFPKGPSR